MRTKQNRATEQGKLPGILPGKLPGILPGKLPGILPGKTPVIRQKTRSGAGRSFCIYAIIAPAPLQGAVS